MGVEIVPGETIPAVTGCRTVAVNFTKGCYPGQELVERMDSRGADAPRSLRVDRGRAATRRSAIRWSLDGTEVGTVTSVSPSGDVALAFVKRGADVGDAAHVTFAECRRGRRRSDCVGRSEVATDRDDLGMLADADQLGGTVDDRREPRRRGSRFGRGVQPADRSRLVAERAGGSGDGGRSQRVRMPW